MMIRKIMLLGDIGVGKTSIVRRLRFDSFEQSYKGTIGLDLYRCDIEPSPADEPFQFLVWDTDGNYGATILQQVHLRRSHAGLIVADVSRPPTLVSMLALARTFLDELPGRHLTLVLNKVDLLGDPGAELDLPPGLAELELPVIRTSALSGHNVRKAFEDAARSIVRRGL